MRRDGRAAAPPCAIRNNTGKGRRLNSDCAIVSPEAKKKRNSALPRQSLSSLITTFAAHARALRGGAAVRVSRSESCYRTGDGWFVGGMAQPGSPPLAAPRGQGTPSRRKRRTVIGTLVGMLLLGVLLVALSATNTSPFTRNRDISTTTYGTRSMETFDRDGDGDGDTDRRMGLVEGKTFGDAHDFIDAPVGTSEIHSFSDDGVLLTDTKSDNLSTLKPGNNPLIVVITPTYSRPTNKPPPQPNALLNMLNAMCQSNGNKILWTLVVQNGDKDPAPKLPSCVPGRHTSDVRIVTIVEGKEREGEEKSTGLIPASGKSSKLSKKKHPPHRGVAQRNAGLEFVRDTERLQNAIDEAFGFSREITDLISLDPLIYFGDDDNEYDPLVFDEISKIKKIGVWPVGFPFAQAPIHVESPVVQNGKVTGYHSKFCNLRRYNVDMVGFALRISELRDAKFLKESKIGHLEDDFLRAALGEDGMERLEPMANGATQVLVWHLGWKLDREKGKWALFYEVKQPAEALCKSVEQQRDALWEKAKAEKEKTR